MIVRSYYIIAIIAFIMTIVVHPTSKQFLVTVTSPSPLPSWLCAACED